MERISTFWNSGFLKLCSNVLDIVLVAFIVYHAIKLIRETRAIQLLKGILLLGCYMLLSIYSKWKR